MIIPQGIGPILKCRSMKVNTILFLLLLILAGCSSDLEINSGHPDVPVVYAVMNPYDTMHYVRVQRIFTINRKEDWAALNPDSLQFQDVEVFVHGKVGDSVKWTEKFSETESDKDDGFFPAGQYQAFVLNHPFPINIKNPDRDLPGIPDIDSLVLEVRIHDQNLTTRAAVKALQEVKIINYKSRELIYVFGTYPSVYALMWHGETPVLGGSTAYQQIDFRFHYKEYFRSGWAQKEISWMNSKGWDDNAYFITPERIFTPMRTLLPKSDSILYRKLDSIDIALLRTSNIFEKYLYIKDYWENTDNPPYTNFDHSYGLFFLIAREEWTGMQLNRQAMDSLCRGYSYKDLKFRY